MKVLIVDDNDEMRREIAELVNELADEVHECADGSEVLAAYARVRPDWVLMDIVMNQLDGLEATRRIISLYPEAKIAIVTNYDDKDIREAARAAGAREYFLKDNLVELPRLLRERGSPPLA